MASSTRPKKPASLKVKKSSMKAKSKSKGKGKGKKKTTRKTPTRKTPTRSGNNPIRVQLRAPYLEILWDGTNKPPKSELKTSASDASRGYLVTIKGTVRPSAKWAYGAYGLGKKHGRFVSKRGDVKKIVQFTRHGGSNRVLKVVKRSVQKGGKTVKAKVPMWVPSKKTERELLPSGSDKQVHRM